MSQVFLKNRQDAGRKLADKLRSYTAAKSADSSDTLVLALPRGGVPVAYEVAMALHAQLDLIIVRKLGLPQHEELAMGAIASGGAHVLNHAVVDMYHVNEETIDDVMRREQQELARRERAYRGDRPWPGLAGKRVILVDDGIATGSTMKAAIGTVRAQHPAQIIMAVPVAPESSLGELSVLVDDAVCLATPSPFHAVGQWYVQFGQTSDVEVQALLAQAWHGHGNEHRKHERVVE